MNAPTMKHINTCLIVAAWFLAGLFLVEHALSQVPSSSTSKKSKEKKSAFEEATQLREVQNNSGKKDAELHRSFPSPDSANPPGRQERLSVVAEPNPAQIGEVVTLFFSIDADGIDASSTFDIDFRDGSPRRSIPITQRRVGHVFESEGTFNVVVTLLPPPAGMVMMLAVRPLKDSLTINVSPVSMTAEPASAEIGQAITFRVQFNPAGQNVRYRFWYDRNGPTSDWQSTPDLRHYYKEAGIFSARAEAEYHNDAGIPVVTPTVERSVVLTQPVGGVKVVAEPDNSTPVGPRRGLSFNTWLLICLAVLGAGYGAAKLMIHPRVRFVFVPDNPLANARTTKPVSIGIQVILKPEVGNGKFAITASQGILTKGSRRNNV